MINLSICCSGFKDTKMCLTVSRPCIPVLPVPLISALLQSGSPAEPAVTSQHAIFFQCDYSSSTDPRLPRSTATSSLANYTLRKRQKNKTLSFQYSLRDYLPVKRKLLKSSEQFCKKQTFEHCCDSPGKHNSTKTNRRKKSRVNSTKVKPVFLIY